MRYGFAFNGLQPKMRVGQAGRSQDDRRERRRRADRDESEEEKDRTEKGC